MYSRNRWILRTLGPWAESSGVTGIDGTNDPEIGRPPLTVVEFTKKSRNDFRIRLSVPCRAEACKTSVRHLIASPPFHRDGRHG